MNSIKKLFLLFSTVLFSSMLQAATLNVPTAEYPTIQDAVDAATPGDTIQLAAATYTENVLITKSLNIIGAGAANTIIDGGTLDRVFFVAGDIDVTIVGLTVRNGKATDGGGVYVQAGALLKSSLAVYDCVFKDNVATTGNGGALANLGLLEVIAFDGCTFSGNTALNGQGGAVSIIAGDLTMVNCTVSGNTAKNGGGCAFDSDSQIDLQHVTITLNTATGIASSKGGGLYPNGASGTVVNSIVCGNTDLFTGTTSGLTTDNVNGLIPGDSNNLRDQDAKLAALANNGGPTTTHALLSGSPALNVTGSSTLTTDQRGFARPQGSGSDIGAYECQFPVIEQGATVTQTMSEDGIPPAGWMTPTISATDLDSTTLTWTKDSGPSHGSATVSGTGASPTVTYAPDANWNGTDSFVVKVTDEVGNTDTVTVTVTVEAVNDAPVNTAAPVISGTRQVGQTLTATSGTWNDALDTAVSGTTAAFTYAYQWQRGAAVDGPWENIGANAATYTLTTADNQKFVRVEVTATDNGVGTPATASTAQASTAAVVARIYNSTQGTYSDTLQAAITAAAAEDVITVSAGSYAEELTIDKKLTLQASGASYEVAGDITFKAADIIVGGCTLSAGHKWIVEAPAKIQDAIVAANANDIVEVKSGTYLESLTISKALNLTGQAGAIVSSAGTAVTVTANGVAVRGFRLNGVIGLAASSLGGLTIENNIIAAGAVGLQLQGLNTAAGAVTVRNNSVVLAAQLAGANPTAAIVVAGAIGPQAVLLRNNTVAGAFTGYVLYAVNTTPATTVQGGTITGVMQGVAVLNINPATGTDYAPSSFVVDGVSVWGFAGNYPALPNNNFHAGVYVFSGGDVAAAKLVGEVTNVTVSGTGKIQQDCAGLYFSDWSTLAGVRQDVKVTGCTVSDNANRGIIVRGANASVEIATSTLVNNGANPVHTGGNDGIGVSVANGAQVNLHHSTIRNPSSVTGGYAVRALYQFSYVDGLPPAVPSLTVRNCVIENNACPSGLLAAAQSGTMDALNNWWGSSVQADVVAKITGSVLYTPWQSSAACDNLVPYGLTLSATSLNENLPVGTDVGTLGSTDTDGNPSVYTLANGGGLSGADNASFTIDGTLLKTAAAFNFESQSSFAICVQVDDGKGGTNWKTFTVTVNDINDAPVITQGETVTASMAEDGVWTAPTVGATDQDAGASLTWSLVEGSGPAHGVATVSGSGAAPTVLTYAPAANYNGSDSFQVRVTDNQGDTDVVTVSVTVSPLNDAPNNTALPSVAGIHHKGQTLTANNGSWDDNTDLVPGALTFTYQWQRATSADGADAADIGGATAGTYLLAQDDNGKYVRVRVTCSDNGEGVPASQSVTLDTAWSLVANAAPVITEGDTISKSMDEDNNPTAWNLTLNATDADSIDTLSWTIASAASHGTASVSGDGLAMSVGYVPVANWNGNDSFSVKVSDGLGGEDTITVNVTVTEQNDAPVCTVVPAVSGIRQVGQTLTATSGTWDDEKDTSVGGSSTLSYGYQWQRADNVEAETWEDIAGATQTIYVLTADDSNKSVRFQVTVSDTGVGVPASTSATAVSIGLAVKPVRNVTRNTFFDTIQAAVTDESTVGGDVIEVADGTYAESVVVSKALTIQKSGAGYTVNGDVTFSAKPITITGCTLGAGQVWRVTEGALIQNAIAAATPGNTIRVAAGTYAENLVVDKALSLLGPNAGKAGYDVSRDPAEAVLVPAVSSPNGEIVMVRASNVTVDGFTIDGDNPALTSTFLGTNGADLDAAEAVTVYVDNVSNLRVVNNVMQNLTYFGVTIFGATYSAPATTGHAIENNLIRDLGTYNADSGVAKWGGGVLLYNSQYAKIAGNVMTNVRTGVQTGNFHSQNPGAAEFQVISGNTIAARRTGVFHNLHTGTPSPYTISGNTITAVANANETLWRGILLGSLDVDCTLSGNVIDGTAAGIATEGYNIWNVAGTHAVVIQGGSVTGVDKGVFANNFEGYSSDANEGAHVALSGVTITASEVGVLVWDSTNSVKHAEVSVSMADGVSISGGLHGVKVAGSSARVTSLGNTALSGQAGDYILIASNAMASVELNATAATFDGKLGSAMDLAELLAVEDKITHRVDNASLGFVRVKAGEVFVTQASGSIQRGVNAATAGDTVYVGPGEFDGKVTISKTVKLLSSDGLAATTIKDTAAVGFGTLQLVGPTTGVQVGDVGHGFTIIGIDNLSAGIEYAAVYLQFANTDTKIIGNKLVAAGDGALVTEYGLALSGLVVTDNEFAGQTFIGPNPAGEGFAQQDTLWNVPRQLVVVQGSGGPVTFSRNVVSGTAGGTNSTGQAQGNTLVTIDTANAVIADNIFSGVSTRYATALRIGAIGTVVSPTVVSGNEFSGGTPGGIFVRSAASATAQINGNSFVGFAAVAGAAISNGGTAMLNAQNNWFGSAVGPTAAQNPGALGGGVGANIDFSPWLGYGTDTDLVAIGFQPDLGTVLYKPVSLGFSVQPVGANLGALFSVQPQITVSNEVGGVATQYNGTVSVVIANNPGLGTLNGALTVPVVAGVATFTDLSITVGGGTGFTLAASSASPIMGATSEVFDIANPRPVLSSMSPIFIAQGSAQFTLTVNGSSFVPNSKVMWGAAERATTFVSAGQLTAVIPATDVASAGTAQVTVFTPATGGGTSETSLTFSVTESALAPVVYVDDNWTGYGDCGGHVWGYDAFNTIQGGVNNVATNGTVNLLAGTYVEAVSVYSKQMNVVGAVDLDGKAMPTIRGTLSIDHPGADTGWHIENINFVADASNGTLLKLKNVNNATVRNCTFDGDGRFLGLPNVNGISFESCPNGNTSPMITDSVFSNGLYTAVTGIASDLTVATCVIENVKSGFNARGSNWVVMNSAVSVIALGDGDTYGIRYGSTDAGSANNLTLTGCTLSVNKNGQTPAPGNYHCAVFIRTGAIGTLKVSNCAIDGEVVNLSSSATLDASGNWWGGADSAVVTAKILAGSPVDYTPWLAVGTDTDSGAIGFKGDFDTLWVDDNSPQVGTTGRIQEGVNLATASGTVNVLAGTYTEHVAVNKTLHLLGADKATTIIDGSGSGVVMTVTANDCTISGFTVRNSGATAADGGIGLVGVSGCVVRDNIATQNAVGIGLLSANNNLVADNAVSANGYGIALDKAGMNPGSTGNNIVSNTVTGNALVGFYASESSGNTLDANTLTANAKGVYLWHANSFTVTRNVMSQNAGHGVELMGCANSTFEYNAVTNNGSTGMIWRETAQTITGNVVRYNDLSGNSGVGLGCYTNTAVILAENNWWGSLKGPTHATNAGGNGAPVSDNVDYSPWLGDGTDTLADIGFQPNVAPVYYTPTHLVFSTEPFGANLGDLLSQQPVVTVINENKETATQFTGEIMLALGVNPGNGTLTGSPTLGCTAGVATFTDLAVTVGGGSGVTLVASTTSPILGATSAAFDVANPMPTAASMSPYWTRAGSDEVTVTVTGTGFTPTSVVLWNPGSGDLALETTYDASANSITAVIPEAYVANIGTANVKVYTPAAGGGTSTPPLVFRIEAEMPAVVYVDDAYAELPDDTVVDWPYTGAGTHIIGYDAFATIYDGVENVAEAGTVNVAAGHYPESVDIYTPGIQVIGPNAGINPITGIRKEEAIIDAYEYGFYVYASSVTIDGFTISGLENEAYYGVWVDTEVGFGGLMLANNIIEDVTECGFYGALVSEDSSSGSLIFQNKFSRAGVWSIYADVNYYASVVDNVIADTSIGIYTAEAYLPEATGSVVWSGNTISATEAGICYNFAYEDATGVTIQSNTITVAESDVSRFSGILLTGIGVNVTPTIRGNSITVPEGIIPRPEEVVGYDVWNVTTTTGMTVEGGVVSGCDYGVWVSNDDGNEGTTVLKLRKVDIRDSGLAGVYVNGQNSNGASVRAELTDGCTITNSAVGILVEGEDASVDVGDTAFTDIAGDYIVLASDSMAGTELNATAATFDGKLGSAMTLDELMAVEDKITHMVDDESLGFVRVKTDNVYVTQASGSIQRGIDAASPSNTVNVAAGIYPESLYIWTDGLKLLGPNAATSPVTGGRVDEAIISAADWYGVYIDVPGVTVAGFTVSGYDVIDEKIVADYGVYAYTSAGFGELTMENNIIEDFNVFGFIGWVGSGPSSSGNVIFQNKFEHIGDRAIVSLSNYYANLIDNDVANTGVGIYAENANQAEATGSVLWSGNTISATRAGIWYNLAYGTATGLTIQSNAITVAESAGTRFSGLWLTSIGGSVNPTIRDNSVLVPVGGVTPVVVGYDVWSDSTSTGVTVEGGVVSGSDYGVWLNNYDSYPTSTGSNGGSTVLKLRNVNISSAVLAGVYVKDNALNTIGSTVRAEFSDGCAINNSAIGVWVDGADASVVLGDTAFTGIANDYVQLTNGCGSDSDATESTFGGKLGSAMSLEELMAIENKITHKVDDINLGFVRVATGAVYVPDASGTIDNAIAAASDGDVIYVEAGVPLVLTAEITKNVTFSGTFAITSANIPSDASATPVLTSFVSRRGTGTVSANLSGMNDAQIAAVNANLAGFALITGNPVTIVRSGTTVGYAPTIQSGINFAIAGDVVMVAAGTYAENVTVQKSVSILGPNAGISPNGGARVAEAIIVPATSAVASLEVFHVEASNVTIDGFVIDGDNPALTSGFLGCNGADMDAAEAVTVYVDNVNGLNVVNNIIQNFSYFGVTIFGATYSAPATTGHAIENNLIRDLGTYDAASGVAKWGGGVLLYNGQYARIAGNVMSNVRIGIQTGNFHSPNPGAAEFQVISGNTIAARRTGVFHNLHTGSPSPYTLSGNTVTAVANANETLWRGMLLGSLDVDCTLSGNVIDGSAAGIATEGYNIWNVAGTHAVAIQGGSVTGVNKGVFANNFEGYSSDANEGAHVALSGITIAASEVGVLVWDSTNSVKHAEVSVSMADGVVISGGLQCVRVVGASAKVTSLGNTALSGQAGDYILIASNAMASVELNATAATFGGKLGSAMDLAELLAVEDKITHRVDNDTLGFVRVKADNVYVTQASGSIQRGIDAASVSNTVNVGAGTFAEFVKVDKSIVLMGDPGELDVAGPGANAPILDGATLAAGNGIDILPGVDQVTIQGFVVRNFKSSGGGVGVGIRAANNTADPTTDVTIRDNLLTGNVWAGVMAWNLGESAYANWDVSYNIVTMGAWSPNTNVYGIELDNAVDSVISHNVVSGGWDGIVVLAAASGSASVQAGNITVSDNAVSGCVDMGIWLNSWKQSPEASVTLSNVTVSGNTITQAGKALLANSYDGTIKDLTIIGNTISVVNPSGAGQAVDLSDISGSSVFSENRITIEGQIGGGGTFFHAVNLGGPATGSWLLEQNELLGNNVGTVSVGYRLRGTLPATTSITLMESLVSGFATALRADALAIGAQVAIGHSDLSANRSSGVLNGSGESIIAFNNWWGHASGPANVTNPGGQGTSVVGPADFSPWLAYGTDTDLAAIGFQPDLGTLHYLPVSLAFSQQPVGGALGALLTTQPWVTVIDEVGGVATQFNGTVTVRIGNNPGEPVDGVLTGNATVTVVAGVATFTDLAITQGSGSGFTLVAESTAPIMSATSETFGVANNAPILDAVGSKSVDEEVELTFTATGSDIDEPSAALTFTLAGNVPDGAKITAGGAFTWMPTEEQGGASYTFTVVVTDNGGPVALSDSETITVTVAEVNVAPVLPSISDQTVNEQGTLSFTVPTASDQDMPTQTLTYTLDAASIAAGMAINGSTGAFSWSPSESQGGTDYNVTVTVTDNGLNLPSLTAAQTFKITVAEINVAPVLGYIPPQSVNFGQTLTFTATATDQDREPTQTLTFSLTDAPAGAAIDPATGVFTWTPTEAQSKENYSFTVTVTDNGSPAMSDSRTVTIGAISAAHTCPGYRSPSTSMVVSNRFDFGGTPDGLTWTPVLPNANWIITAADASGNGVAVVSNGTAVVFTTLPITSPVVFSYTVSVPGDQSVSNSLGAAVSFNGLTADVAPIAIYRYHSADYRADVSGTTIGQFRKIDSTEINRVLAYWRYGYKPDTAGLDGFVATSGYAGAGGRHSADYDETPWQIDTDEAGLVLEYWRQGGYHADPDGEDGYASTRTGPGPSLLMFSAFGMDLLLPPATTVNGPVAYNPGKTVTVTNTFFTGSTEKLSYFTWNLRVPGGWRVTGVSGDGSPLLDPTGTSVLLSAQTLPTTEVRLVVTYSVPLNAIGACEVGAEARYKFAGMVRALTLSADPLLALGPLDANSDGLADTWAASYGITDPSDDEDGDGMNNLAEYLCGTIPQDGTSYLRMVNVKPMPGVGVEVSWSSEAGRTYILLRAQGKPEGFTEFKRDLQAGPSGRSSTVDESVSTEPCFYRVKLQQ